MTTAQRLIGGSLTVIAMATVATVLGACGSSTPGGAADAARGTGGALTSGGGAGAATGGAGGLASAGAGGSGSGGTTIAGAGGHATGGSASGGTGAVGVGGTSGGGVGGTGAGGRATGGVGTGGSQTVRDGGPEDVPIVMDSSSEGAATGGRGGSGGAGSGGSSNPGGTGGAGGIGAGGTSSTAGKGGTGGTGTGGSTGLVRCPDELPAAGAACTANGQTCRYGDHPLSSCRPRATCTNGAWQLGTVAASCSDPLPQAGCPATPQSGADCSTQDLTCNYATGDNCTCTWCTRETPACIFTDPVVWHCWTPPGGSCPAVYPNLGSACTLSTATRCRYRCDAIAACSADGIWVSAPDACPICNSPDTPIATPEGNRAVASLVPGDLVYSIDHGRLAIVPIAEVGSQAAPFDHHVMHVLLATGTELEISPNHPTADGRTLGDLTADDRLDGVRVVSATLVPYRHSRTYDIRPASDTGTYFAGGVLIGSTMAPAVRVTSVTSPASPRGMR